jgi:hypothetical protein
MLQSQLQRTMPAHAETCNAALLRYRKMMLDQIRQFLADIAFHLVMLRPRCFSCIDIKSGALSKIMFLTVGNMPTAWRGIRENHDNIPLRRKTLDPALLNQFRTITI